MLNKLRAVLRPTQGIDGAAIFGVGAAKTGTHSLAAMFEPYVASEHEPDQTALIDLFLDRERTGKAAPLIEFMRDRQRAHPLKVNASQINIYLLEEICTLFPDARFVLTMRHPLDWLRSILDDSLRRDIGTSWQRFRNFRFGKPAQPGGADDALARAGLYTLEGYLRYWADAMRIPVERLASRNLMIVQTEDLHARSEEIATFCGIDNYRPDEAATHAFANPHRFGLVGKLDRSHVLGTLKAVCGDLLLQYYPGVDARERLEDVIRRDVDQEQMGRY